MSELENAMQILWHEIQTSEGADAWEKVKQFIDNLNN
jgi:hypothetical protein